MTTFFKIPTSDDAGEIPLYVAEPDGKPRATLLVVHEIYGLNTDIRRKCDLLAQQGYLAMAPDLFWRLEAGVELDPYIASTRERSIALAKRFDSDAGVRDIQTTIDFARKVIGEGLRVGLIGYSLGARMAAFAVARTTVDVAVGYYGVRIHIMLGELQAISRPLMLHIAVLDRYVDRDMQAELQRAFDSHPFVTLHKYADQQHDFAYEFGTLRADLAATLAEERTMAFLESRLGLAKVNEGTRS